MKFILETHGCKVNQFESSAIAKILIDHGHEQVTKNAELCIINTCTVTGEAARKCVLASRRLKTQNPGTLLAICGCASQEDPAWAQAAGAILIGGSGDRVQFAESLHKLITETDIKSLKEPIVFDAVTNGLDENIGYETLPILTENTRTRASLKIEDGCENFCSYCVVPLVRGRVRSLPLPEIEKQAKLLTANGFSEIVLTGIEIASYGSDIGSNLLQAVKTVSKAAPKARIRLSSLEPSVVDKAFIASLKQIPNLCDHFHLSLQSGSNKTLARMKRKYDTSQYYNSLSMLREAFPNAGMTTDLIVGFPSETPGEFEETLLFVTRCSFSGIHIFPYSKRKGTLAADMPGVVLAGMKATRASTIRSAVEKSRKLFLAKQIGKTLDVIFETQDDNGIFTGHSSNYLTVKAPGVKKGERCIITADQIEGDAIIGHAE